MTNSQAVDRMDQTHAYKIGKMFWIAAQIENSDLKEFLDEIDDRDIIKLFPKEGKAIVKYRQEDIVQLLVDSRKFGIIAEVYYPRVDNVRYYEDGTIMGWSSNACVSRIGYVYAETLQSLMRKIELQGDKIFKEYIAADKK